MLEHAQHAARDADVRNVTWTLGADTDIPALRRLLGDDSVGAVTIAQALHWMNHQDLFRAVVPLARFDVFTTAVDHVVRLDIDQLVGGVYSAMGSRLPAADQRPAFAEQVRAALAPRDHFSERVHVAILVGTH